MNERIKMSLSYIESAKNHLLADDKEKALKAYTDAFYLRCTNRQFIDIQFHVFFQYQFSKYLTNKKTLRVSLPEGDMVADLIKGAYDTFLDEIENSPFNIAQTDTLKLLKSIKLVFPVQIDTEKMA